MNGKDINNINNINNIKEIKKIKEIKILSHSAKSKIDHWLTKFPKDKRQSAVLYALKVVQEEEPGHYLSQAAMDSVAAYLDMPNIAVYEVASFYSLFDLSPVGRHKISVCTNISCMLNNSDAILEHLKNRLGVDINETTPDGRFTLKEVECLCACGGAPVMQVGDCYHENLTVEKIDRLLEELE